jgi:uncharacterized protein (DUF1015 family)
MVPDFFPFPGLRYRLDAIGTTLDQLTAPPYDVIDAEARARLEAAHPVNAVHLILPRDVEPGDRYRRAAEAFADWRTRGVLQVDPPSFYLYRMGYREDGGRGREMSGVVGALRLAPPERGEILPHERTMPKPRGDRLDLMRAVRANLDPVWCLSLAPGLSASLPPVGPAAASCVDGDGVEHRLTRLPASGATEAMARGLAAVVNSAPVVIADGHHRYETALAYQEEADEPAADMIMALVVELAEDQLSVRAIHRLLTGAGPRLRERLTACATLTPAGPNTPEAVRRLLGEMDRSECMGFIDAEGLALLRLRPDVLGPELDQLPESLQGVDSARLEVALGHAGRPTLDYHPDAGTVAAAVAKGTSDAAVLLRSVSVAQIQAVAAAGERMPEKTTFFQPKPLTGLVFRSLEA